MTRQHPNRRAELVHILVELIATRGLDAVSVREVAQHANVSIGAVQHHFPTRSTMILAAAELVGEEWRESIVRATPDAPASEVLRQVTRQLLPTEATSRLGRVWLAFVALAAVDEKISAVHAHDWKLLEERLSRRIETAWAEGNMGKGRNALDEAATLLALLDGLSMAIVTEPDRMPIRRAFTILDRYLDTLLHE